MSKKAEEGYFERLNDEVVAAYTRMGDYTPEEMSKLKQFAQVMLGKQLVNDVRGS